VPGQTMSTDVARVVALGASNLTRGFQTIVSTARAAWGPDVEILAAFGHGRSYGVRSRVGIRALPGILESGLWSELGSRPKAATRGLVTDVGNDIAYGFSAEQTLAWVEEALGRLSRVTQDIVVTDLPLASIRRLSKLKFLAFRSIVVPSCRLSLVQVLETAERVNVGLAKLSTAYGARFFRLDPAWYGFDPIHVRPSLWRRAWQEILGAEAQASPRVPSVRESLLLYFMRPERRFMLGVEQITPQRGVPLPSGGRVWLY
jgi:hypothetical protein